MMGDNLCQSFKPEKGERGQEGSLVGNTLDGRSAASANVRIDWYCSDILHSP